MDGVTHGDEIQYLFDYKEAGYFEQCSDDGKMMDFITGLFTRFAATGNPNEPGKKEIWKPANKKQFSMAFINTPDENGNIKTGTVDPYMDRYRIWDDLFHFRY
uniref:Carboxylesterase type B domain-containing protein n=1 Tax=Megaselia scalaris TaxID=36166 RepID=T1H012_MEGSC